MNKKKIAAEVAATENTATVPAKGKVKRERKELHDLFWMISIILGVVGILFVLIAKNALNGSGYWSIQPFGIKNPIKLTFLTSSVSAWIAAGLSVVSIGFGLTRNFMKRQNLLMGYLIGLVALILSIFALLAIKYS